MIDKAAPAAGLAGSTAIVVLGMHRSGTSAVAGLLHHLGVVLGPRLMAASPDNPRGYWEHVDVVRLHDELLALLGRAWNDVRPLPPGWAGSEAARRAQERLAAVIARDFAGSPLWGIKDPRLCRLLPLWLPLFEGWGVAPRFLLALRNPQEVAASLAARDGLSGAHAGLLWLRHVIEAERDTRPFRRAIVHYEALLESNGWRREAPRLAAAFGIIWPQEGGAADLFLSSELRHRHAGNGERLCEWIEAVYAAFAGNGDIAGTCDAVAGELARADRLFLPIIADERAAAAEAVARLARSERENLELRAQLADRPTTPSAAIPPALPVAQAYASWIAQRASTALAHRQWLEERAAQWPRVPQMALAMILPAGTEARVGATLQSLQRQLFGDWRLCVAAEGAMPEMLAGEPRLEWLCGDGPPADALNRCLSELEVDWLALIDAGDQLAPHALFSVAEAFFRHGDWGALYSDEDRVDLQGLRSGPHFKPDFNLELLRGLPYVGALLAVRRDLFAEIGGFDPARDGSEEYDLALRLAERLGPAGFGHVSDILYHRLTVSGRSKRPVAAICADMPAVVQAHLDRTGVAAQVETGSQPHFCRVRYRHEAPEPLVSIIVPTRDRLPLLRRCVEAVLAKTAWRNYELVVVDNGSTELDACAYLRNIEDKVAEIGGRIRVLRHPGAFNFAAMNNRAVRETAQGDFICLLNNDAAPLGEDWLGEMMALARRPQTGAVGAKLLFADGRIQHAGVVLGVGNGMPAEHPFGGEPANAFGYWGRLQVAHELSAVTAACLVTGRSIYEALGGLDETAFAVAYNDVDYCLRVRAAGYHVLWTPHAQLLHDGGASQRGGVEDQPLAARQARFATEQQHMFRRWLPQIAFDPAYNRNLSSLGSGFAVETEGAPTWDPGFRPRPRVLVYAADREGCGEYRVIAPCRALLQADRLHCYETMRLMTPPEIARIAPDSVVFQRQLEAHQIAAIDQVKALSDAFRVFEIDDLITNLPRKSVHRRAIAPDIGERLKRALALCDRLVVSTEPLAQAYGRLCAEVAVAPNRLEKRRWLGLDPQRRAGRPRVGWAGAVGHAGDLAVIAGVVEATAREIDWVFFGMCPEGLQRLAAEVHAWVPLDDYPTKLASLDLDLAVAPLEQHPFNEAKSNLRLLEYGVLGYPVVCTDIAPYRCGLPVVRVNNRPRAWIGAIRDMVADRESCRAAGAELRAATLGRWMLEDCLDDWQRAWLR